MSSDDATTTPDEESEAGERDELREGQLDVFRAELGEALVGSHIRPGKDLWVRVERDAWQAVAKVAKAKLKCDFFDFLSAIDWMPSPFGRNLDSQEDIIAEGIEAKELPPMTTGYAGGDTRFQVLARLQSTTGHFGVNFKADLPDDDLSVETWIPVFAGANWHEREANEMFGIHFNGHPDLRHIYLPAGFEGYPLRKDFPLLSRRVKPWPGIVDIEQMPDTGNSGSDSADAQGGED